MKTKRTLSIILVAFSKLIETTTNTNNIRSRRLKTQGLKRPITPIQQRILKELRNLQNLEQLNPQCDAESRRKFFSNFNWKDSMLQQHEIRQIETLLVDFHDIFARQRFDIGVNEEFTVKSTPVQYLRRKNLTEN